MTIPPAAGSTSEPTWVPVDACTLPTADQPLRVAGFDALFATALQGIERPAPGRTRARLILAGDDGLSDRVRELVAAETACCSFFSLAVTNVDAGAALALDVEVPVARTDVLDALLDRASAVRGTGPS